MFLLDDLERFGQKTYLRNEANATRLGGLNTYCKLKPSCMLAG